MNSLKVLFIGNSHTYVNGVPKLVKEYAENDNIKMEVAMIAHPGVHLKYHLDGPEASFNILNGNYNYVVIQEYTHPFVSKEELASSVKAFSEIVNKTNSKLIMYGTWAAKVKREDQSVMNDAFEFVCKENNILFANVGDAWWDAIDNAHIELYGPDGEHASIYGSRIASNVIWKTIFKDLDTKK